MPSGTAGRSWFIDLLPIFHDFEQDLVDRVRLSTADAGRPLESDEVVLVLIEDQAGSLEREGNVVALAILGQWSNRESISPVTSTRATKSPSTSVKVIGALCRGFFLVDAIDDLGSKRVHLAAGISILIFKLSSSLVSLQSLSGSIKWPSMETLLRSRPSIMLRSLPADDRGRAFRAARYSLGLE